MEDKVKQRLLELKQYLGYLALEQQAINFRISELEILLAEEEPVATMTERQLEETLGEAGFTLDKGGPQPVGD